MRATELLDLLAMGQMGAAGNTQAHFFLEDQRLYKKTPKNVAFARHVAKVYEPPNKPNDRVLLFADHSGAYLFEDGFATIMGSDIRHEVNKFKELN